MPRVCTVCTHPERVAIDKQLATGNVVLRRIASTYGLVETSIRRHEASHLAPDLIEAARAKVSDNGTDLSLIGRVTRMVDRLEKLAEQSTEYGAGKDLLAAARELRPYHELFGRANGQLATDKVNALFIGWGVRDEAEVTRSLDLTRRGKDSSPEEWAHDATAMQAFALPQCPPAVQYAIIKEMQRIIGKVGMLEPHVNGKNGAGS